jgi:Ca-activated chloride channel family protein
MTTTTIPIDVAVETTRDVISRKGGIVHTRLRVSPTESATPATRRAVAMAIVLDRSGSMGDVAVRPDTGHARHAPTKLEFVKQAAARLVESMADGDAVCVVSFDDAPRLEVPMTVLGGDSRAAVGRAIRGIACGGSTNLWEGLERGIAQLIPALQATCTAKVLVLSDGLANVGPRTDSPAFVDRCATAATDGITVSTFGVGVQYDSALLGQMADAGNGDFHHIESPDVLDEVFAEELRAAAVTAARGVVVEVRLPGAVAIGDNLNGYPQEDIEDGIAVHLGDVTRGKDLVLELSTPVEVAAETIAVDTRLCFTDAAGSEMQHSVHTVLAIADAQDIAVVSERIDVVRRVVELLEARARMRAAAFVDAGDAQAAGDALRGGTLHVASVAAAYASAASACAATTADLRDMEDEIEQGKISALKATRLFQQSRDVNRSRDRGA